MSEDSIEKVKNLSDNQWTTFIDDLLGDDEDCDNACQIFLSLVKCRRTLSDLVLRRLCHICIDEYQPQRKKLALEIIKLALDNNQKLPDILSDLSKALVEKHFPEYRRYASNLLYHYIRTSNNITIDEELLKTMSNLLNDSLSIVQSYMLLSFEELLVRNHKHEIPQDTIDHIENLLSTDSANVQQNYMKCAFITSFFFQLSKRHYKLNRNLLEIFSNFLSHEENIINDSRLNRCAAYLLNEVVEHHLYDGTLSDNVLNNISIFFNEISSRNKELREYSLRILNNLTADQLHSMHLDSNLLNNYLTDPNIEDCLRSTVARVICSHCQTCDDSTLHTLIEGLGNQILMKDYIFALHSIIKRKQNNLNSISLRNITQILDKDNMSNEIRQYACSIIELVMQDNPQLTKYDREVLLNALSDPNLNISNTVLIIFQHFFKNEDNCLIESAWIDRITVLLTELVSNRDENVCTNASILLKLIVEKRLKQEFTEYEISNISIVLQTHPNELIRKYCFDILHGLDEKHANIPSSIRDLIKLELTTREILNKNVLNEQDSTAFEAHLHVYLNDMTFGNKILPMNVFETIDRMLKMNLCQVSLFHLVLQYVQNGQKLPNKLINSLANQLSNDNENIFIKILYYVVHNGQSILHRHVEDLIKLMLINEIYSKYTIQIFKLLISRNEIQPNEKIYENSIILLETTRDCDLQRHIIETIAYSLQITPIHNFQLNSKILQLIEHHFQISKDKDMIYYSCLALCSIIDHGQILSEVTLNRLKLYVQEDPINCTSSKINLRTMAVNALKSYIRIGISHGEKFDHHEIETILKQEALGRTILENLHSPASCDAANTLLSMIDGKPLSTFNMQVLESCLVSDDVSIELKLTVIKIFRNLVRFLQSSHIISMIKLMDYSSLNAPITEVIEQLIHHKIVFPDLCFQLLLNFISKCEDSLLRDRIIDDFEAISKYSTITSNISSLIRLEITAKELRNPNLTIDRKSFILKQWKDFASQGYNLSKNVIQSFKYILNNHEFDESVITIIELANRNGQKMTSELMNVLNHLLKQSQLSKTRIISTISNMNQEFITQETLTNSENDLLENLSDSYSILLKGAQNGCQLSQVTTNRLTHVLKNPTEAKELLSTIQIFQNLAQKNGTLDNETVRYLEETLQVSDINIQKSILNTLKYLSNYKPSHIVLSYLKAFFTRLPAEFNVEDLLEKFIKLRIQDVLHITYTLLIVEYVPEDLHDKPIDFLCRDLLCTELLLRIRKNDAYDQMTQFKFYANLNELENYFGLSPDSFVRDEALVFLIENHANLFLNDINEILLMLKTNGKAFYFIRTHPNDWLQQLRINWLQTILSAYPHIKTTESTIVSDDDAMKIVDLLMNTLKFSLSLSESLLQRISNVNSGTELIDFLESLYLKNMHKELDLWEYFTKKENNTIHVKDIYVWSFELECDLIKKKFIDLQCFNHTNTDDLHTIISQAYSNNWSLETFEDLFETLKTKQHEPFIAENFWKTFSIINNYSIDSTVTNKDGQTAQSVFKSKQSNEWLCAMQKFALSVIFDQDEREKSLKDLMDELFTTNHTNEKLKASLNNLEQKYRDIMLAYHQDSQLCSIGKPINVWDENDVLKWSMEYKLHPNDEIEVICVVKRAIYLHNKKQQFEPRTIQILSLLLMLDASNNNIARLAQIKTGEGKSVIIAMFAAIKALNGHKVDIVTTSPLLAKRDAENKQSFYQMLNLTVGENSGSSATKPCYKNDIVYGEVNEFQFDILRDEYSMLGTRCGRPFDIAIVDEVDSMLIDDNSKICRLSSKIPAIDELKVLLALIWQELNRVCETFVRINDKLYCATVPFTFDNNGQMILLKPKSDDPNAATIDAGIDDDDDDDDNNFTASTANNSNEQQFIEVQNNDNDDLIEVEDTYEFVENHIKNYVENKLLKPDENNRCLLYVPKHLNAFIKQQINKWINSAWQAKFTYCENVDYLITNGSDGVQSVVPIDYRNTGIVQTNTAWPNGLHQFLQIKHKLRVSAENLTTNFLSNIGFFSRFDERLFGFTGTLGSKDAQELIRCIYNVDFLIVPPYKYTQFKEFSGKLTQNEQEWLDECTKSIYNEAKIHQRAVLVISETKSDATKIYEKLNDMKNQIKLYTRSDNEEQNAINNELDCGQIIVATNLAGRGTDIGTTRAVEENGGLHVLVTFLPLNTRVEHQAFGRTARQGKRGTAQLIVRASLNENNSDMEKLKEDRDEQEKKDILLTQNIEVERIRIKDRLFKKYCDLREKLRDKENDRYKLDCVEELWGFWLKNVLENEDETSYEKKFEEFRKKIENVYSSNRLFENPFHLILKANEYIFKRKKYDEAIQFLRMAIEIDTLFTVNARYNLAYALIQEDKKNKTQAKEELRKALQIIEETLIPQQETMLISFRISNKTNGKCDDIEEQVTNRINLLYLFKSQVEHAIEVIEDAESKDHKVVIEFKNLDEFFSDTNKPTLDIKEFRDNGLVGFFQLTRKEPTPWFSIIAVGILGIAQAVAGAALIVFTCGAAATIGTMLLSEGIGDMIIAVKSAITGEFSWKEYAIQKVISLAITISTCGMAALKETGRAIKLGFRSGINLVTGKTATIVGRQAVGQITKEGWKLVGKQIAIGFAKQGVKEMLKTVLDKTVLAELSKKIHEEFTNQIKDKLTNEINTNQMIRDLLIVDASLNRKACQNEIEILTRKILHPQSNEFVYIASSIAKGILNQLSKGVSGNLIQIFTAGTCLAELATFLDRFLDEFRRNLNKLIETLRIGNLLQSTKPTEMNTKTAEEIAEQLRQESVIASNGTRILKEINPSVFVLKKHKKYETHVIQVCNNIYTETTKNLDYALEKSLITRSLTDQLASYMTNRLNNELINPVVHRGADGVVNNLSNRLEIACVGTNETLEKKLERRRAQNFIRQQGEVMIKNVVEQKQEERITLEKNPAVEHLARNTETDSPGTLMDIMALSAKLGRPIVIFRNGKYDMTIGDSQNGQPLKIDYLEDKTGSIGHYGNIDTHTTEVSNGSMSCLYDRISEQTNISSDELRQMAASTIRENADHYQKMLPAVLMLAEYDNKGLLYIGGKNKETPDETKPMPYIGKRPGKIKRNSNEPICPTSEERHITVDPLDEQDSAETETNYDQAATAKDFSEHKKSHRGRHTIIQERWDVFIQAVNEAINSNNCKRQPNGEWEIKLRKMKLTDIVFTDNQNIPDRDADGNKRYSYKIERYIGAPVFVYGDGRLLHLKRIEDKTPRTSSKQR